MQLACLTIAPCLTAILIPAFLWLCLDAGGAKSQIDWHLYLSKREGGKKNLVETLK